MEREGCVAEKPPTSYHQTVSGVSGIEFAAHPAGRVVMLRGSLLCIVALEAAALRIDSLRAGTVHMNFDRVFSAAEAKGGSDVDATKTAVLFIEYQNEFTSEGGKLHDAVKGTMGDMLDKSAALASRARDAGATVMVSPHLASTLPYQSGERALSKAVCARGATRRSSLLSTRRSRSRRCASNLAHRALPNRSARPL